MRRSGALLALLTAAGLPACGAASPARVAAQASPALTADVQQFRRDAERRVVQIALTNAAAAPVAVEQVALSSPGFGPVPPTTSEAQLQPGSRTNFPVPYGDPRCATDATVAPAVALVTIRGGDGTARAVTLSLASGEDDLERVRAKDCTQQALRRAVRLSLDDWRLEQDAEGHVARAQLRLRREKTAEAVSVDDFGGNVLYTIRARPPAAAPLVTLAADQADTVLPLDVRATRCDPHALAESKQSYVFRLYLVVGTSPAALTTVRADGDGSRLLDELTARSCLPGR